MIQIQSNICLLKKRTKENQEKSSHCRWCISDSYELQWEWTRGGLNLPCALAGTALV